MGTAERRQREKEKRRNDIIDAAEKVFFSKGLDGATMEEVAEEAELSKGTLYLYFQRKDDLYGAIAGRAIKLLTARFEEAIARHVRGIERVGAIGDAYIGFYHQYPDYFNALLHHQGHRIEEFTSDNPLEALVKAIRSGIEDGSIKSELDPLKTAVILWGQTSGILQVAYMRCDALKEAYAINPEEIISYCLEMIHSMLKA